MNVILKWFYAYEGLQGVEVDGWYDFCVNRVRMNIWIVGYDF